jgi:hypothetical protein
MQGIAISLLFGAPWIAAIAWTWSRAPRADRATPSAGERALERLSTL